MNTIDKIWNGFCPESQLHGKQVRMRLNRHDFFESEATGLQIFEQIQSLQIIMLMEKY
jgi:hypothetical protein